MYYRIMAGTSSNIHDHNLDILPTEVSLVAFFGDLHLLAQTRDEYLDPEQDKIQDQRNILKIHLTQ